MTEHKHVSPAVGEHALRELHGRRERDGLVEELVEAARHYRGFVDLEIPSVVVCPTCAPIAPEEFDSAKLRLHEALEAPESHDGDPEPPAQARGES